MEDVAFSPPVLDLSQWTDNECNTSGCNERISQAWDEAFSQYGFVVLIGHGIDSEMISGLQSQAASFFSQPVVDKMRDHHGPYGCAEGGYTPVYGEVVSKSMVASANSSSTDVHSGESTSDLVESYVIHAAGTQRPPSIPLADEYLSSMHALLRQLWKISAMALKLTELDYFDKYFDPNHPQAMGHLAPDLTLRLAYYPPVESITTTETTSRRQAMPGESADRSAIRVSRYGAHTDYLTYTVLCPDASDWTVDGAGGLEVQLSGGEWRRIKLPDGAREGLIVNAGDLVQRWTNDRWRSPVHRVVGPDPGSLASKRHRLSLVYFTGPILDSPISTIPGVFPKQSSKKAGEVYETVITSDYLHMKLNPTSRC